MSHMITITGREHYLSTWQQLANEPTIEEVAHALALINRFNGHTSRPYSVAEHSLLVMHIARLEGASTVAQMAALMHDAHEAYTGDVPTPVKKALGEIWTSFEHQQASHLQNTFGIRSAMVSHRANIRRWDLTALATERRDVTAYNPDINSPWPFLDTPDQEFLPMEGPAFDLNATMYTEATWQEWRGAFLLEHASLEQTLEREREGYAA